MKLDDAALTLARTHYHTLGAPRNFQLSPDAKQLYFTRSASDTSNVHSLWVQSIKSGDESLLFDPLQHAVSGESSAEEQKQREILRESSHGVTSYVLSDDGSQICFSCNGALWLSTPASDTVETFEHVSGAFDARFDPTGKVISYVDGTGVWIIDADTKATARQIIANESDDIYWGRAEFIASEEFSRFRGYWWSLDSTALAISRVDETTVADAYRISDDPIAPPTSIKYPAAGTANAVVSLWIYPISGNGKPYEIIWDTAAFPYLINVQWRASGLFITVQSRDQKTLHVLRAADSGKTSVFHTETSQHWVDIIQPLPVITDDNKVISLQGETKRRLAYDGGVITPSEHHVDDYIGKFGNWLIYTASPDPKERIVFAVDVTTKLTEQLSDDDGLFSGLVTKTAVFIAGSIMGKAAKQRFILQDIPGTRQDIVVKSLASQPAKQTKPIYLEIGAHKLQASLVLPDNYKKMKNIPVILQIYGGSGHQEVMYSRSSYLEHQWWADQGYAVLATDGPGSPGKDLTWEHQLSGDLITAAAAAHVEVLAEALRLYPQLDGSRVSSRGWSFGGYMSAFLPVLYPEQIQASISVAPVTDWRLYDTHYTERYLGMPADRTKDYDASSLLVRAKTAYRPILLVHGLHDDNVLTAHSLQLLRVLNEANCPYQFLPISSFSHFPKEIEQSAWLLQMELDFLRARLG